MTAKIEGKEIVIRIDLEPNPQPSKSGKTLVIASTHGNQAAGIEYKGKPVTIGLNAYTR